MRLIVLLLLVSALFPSVSHAQAPVFELTKGESTIKFAVKGVRGYRRQVRQVGRHYNNDLA